MSQEKVREILSHVDMTKIDLSSFKLSEKKFDELSHLYKNMIVLSCVCIITQKDNHTQKEIDHAFSILQKVIENPNVYSYSYIYAIARQAMDDAINDVVTYRDRSINDIKIKEIEKRIKKTYKQMRKNIELALENGNTFEEDFDDSFVEKCLRIAKDAIESGRQKAAEAHANQNPAMEQQYEQNEFEASDNAETEKTAIEVIVDVHSNRGQSQKLPFWKRIFRKAEVSANV